MTETVFTIGHSMRSAEEFAHLLESNGVAALVDVRAVPGSRRNPQFGPETLPRLLAEHDIEYARINELGGRRYSPVGEETINGGWRNHSFRSYADYMQTAAFHDGIVALLEIAQTRRVAIMCAEAVPWRCHRSLIADALLIRDVEVLDIMSPTSTKPHQLTSFARVDGERLWYPPIDEGSP